MRLTSITYSLFSMLISSCATLNVSEIENLKKTKFDSLSLTPNKEVHNLRIDLIRQTYETIVNDSTKETKKTPYHPLGFDLGNGLFYDLNENLCLRLDYFLDFSPDNNFEIQKTNRPEKDKGVTTYRYINDSLFIQYPLHKNYQYRYHRKRDQDSTLFMYKKRLKYAIIETDSSLAFCGKKRTWDIINKIDDSNYYLNKKRRKENYQIKDTNIFLENDYIVSLTDNDSKLEIKNNRKIRKDRLLYTIEKNNEKLFIYNKNYSGLLIVFDKKDCILIFINSTLIRKFEKLNVLR